MGGARETLDGRTDERQAPCTQGAVPSPVQPYVLRAHLCSGSADSRRPDAGGAWRLEELGTKSEEEAEGLPCSP